MSSDGMLRRAGGHAARGAAERRRDPSDPGSRKTYTRQQFIEFYGPRAGAEVWRKAPAPAAAATSPRGRKGPPTAAEGDEAARLGASVMSLVAKHFDSLRGRRPTEAIGGDVQLQPGFLAKQFPENPSEHPRRMEDILKDVEDKVLPGVTHWQHPNFMAFYPSATSLPAVFGDTIAAAVNSVGLQWAANPIGTELEVVVMDWLAQMIGIGGPFLHRSGKGGGLMRGTASEVVVDMMVVARVQKQKELHLKMGMGSAEARELSFCADSSKFVAYMSDQTHFCGPKGTRVAGIRLHQLKAHMLDNGNYGVSVADVRAAIAEDVKKGLVPLFVLLNHGSTNTCGYDEIDGMAAVAKEHGVWVHVDAAYAGASWILPERHDRTKLLQENADSFNFNGSKWFLCGFDSAFYWVKDRVPLKDTFAATDTFMAPAGDGVFDPEFKDWSTPLGRRFRALRIWMVIEYFGVEGMRQYIRDSIAQADWLRKQIDDTTGFGQVAKTDLGLVCMTATKRGSDVTVAVAEALKNEGKFLALPSQVDDKPHLRIALGGANTSLKDVKKLWHSLVRIYEGI